MGYSKEFDATRITVPDFLLSEPWVDFSWHNDVCPRFHNDELGFAVWVDFDDPAERELNTIDGPFEENIWKKFTVVRLIPRVNDVSDLADDLSYSTEEVEKLEQWLALVEALQFAERALDAVNSAPKADPVLADDLTTIVAQITEHMNDLND